MVTTAEQTLNDFLALPTRVGQQRLMAYAGGWLDDLLHPLNLDPLTHRQVKSMVRSELYQGAMSLTDMTLYERLQGFPPPSPSPVRPRRSKKKRKTRREVDEVRAARQHERAAREHAGEWMKHRFECLKSYFTALTLFIAWRDVISKSNSAMCRREFAARLATSLLPALDHSAERILPDQVAGDRLLVRQEAPVERLLDSERGVIRQWSKRADQWNDEQKEKWSTFTGLLAYARKSAKRAAIDQMPRAAVDSRTDEPGEQDGKSPSNDRRPTRRRTARSLAAAIRVEHPQSDRPPGGGKDDDSNNDRRIVFDSPDSPNGELIEDRDESQLLAPFWCIAALAAASFTEQPHLRTWAWRILAGVSHEADPGVPWSDVAWLSDRTLVDRLFDLFPTKRGTRDANLVKNRFARPISRRMDELGLGAVLARGLFQLTFAKVTSAAEVLESLDDAKPFSRDAHLLSPDARKTVGWALFKQLGRQAAEAIAAEQGDAGHELVDAPATALAPDWLAATHVDRLPTLEMLTRWARRSVAAERSGQYQPTGEPAAAHDATAADHADQQGAEA